MCCANVYNNLAHDPQAGTNTRSQPEFAPTRKQAARTYTRRDQQQIQAIRPIMPAETNVHSISRSVNGFIKPTSYPTQ